MSINLELVICEFKTGRFALHVALLTGERGSDRFTFATAIYVETGQWDVTSQMNGINSAQTDREKLDFTVFTIKLIEF